MIMVMMMMMTSRRLSQSLCELNSISLRPKSNKVFIIVININIIITIIIIVDIIIIIDIFIINKTFSVNENLPSSKRLLQMKSTALYHL